MKGFGSHMTFNYPSGTRVNKQTVQTKTTRSKGYGNRGATLENDLNVTNKFYVDSNRANIHKKPTPIQIVDVHYPRRSAAVITEAYRSEERRVGKERRWRVGTGQENRVHE